MRTLWVVIVATGTMLAVTPGHAACPDNNPNPVVSLVKGLEIRNARGAVIDRKLDYLEIVKGANPIVSFDQDAEIETFDGETGLVEAGHFLAFGGNDCTAQTMTVFDLTNEAGPNGEENELQAKGLLGITEALLRAGPLPEAEACDGAPSVPDTKKDGTAAERIYMRAGPSDEACVLGTSQLYAITFIHNSVGIHNAATKDIENWYFVGSDSAPVLGPDPENPSVFRDNKARSLRGWVREDEFVVWPQRQAIFPRSSNAPNGIFSSPSLKIRKVDFVYIDEAGKQQNVPLLKLPLLRSNKEANDPVLEVAIPTLWSEGEASEPAVGIVADNPRVLLAQLADRADKLDVLVVLDNSESMKPYRKAVLDGVIALKDVVENFSSMRIGFAFYGDFYNQQADADSWSTRNPRNGFEPAWVERMPFGQPFQFWMTDFAWQGEIPDTETLENDFGQEYSDPQVDKEEMGLPALHIALETANWRPDAQRLVLFIGDDESRVEPNTALASSIRGANVIVLPINVAGSNPLDSNNQAWMRQARELGQLAATEPGGGGVLEPQQAFSSADLQKVIPDTTQRVYDVIGGFFSLANVIVSNSGSGNDLASVREQARKRAQQYGVLDAGITDDYLKLLLNANTEAMEAVGERRDLIRTGFYPQEEAKLYVALTRREHNGLNSAMRTACIGMSTTGSVRGALEDMADEMAEAFLGEERRRNSFNRREGLAEFFSRLTHLPVEYFGVFGKGKTIDDFVKELTQDATKAEYQEVQKELCLSSLMLEEIRDNNFVQRADFDFKGFDDDLNEPIFELRAEPKKFDWLWGAGVGLRVYFVPQEFFPRG